MLLKIGARHINPTNPDDPRALSIADTLVELVWRDAYQQGMRDLAAAQVDEYCTRVDALVDRMNDEETWERSWTRTQR